MERVAGADNLLWDEFVRWDELVQRCPRATRGAWATRGACDGYVPSCAWMRPESAAWRSAAWSRSFWSA